MRTVITSDGDLVDLVVWRETGRTAGALEIVLDVNRHLAGLPEVLPAGIAIVIPAEAEAAAEPAVFRLWE